MITRIINYLARKWVPNSFQLPLLYYAYILSETPEQELLYLEKIITNTRVAIDIGANVGYWTYKLSKLFDLVYSFEFNEDCYKYIDVFNAPNVSLFTFGLSKTEAIKELYLPIHQNGFISHGWGTFEKSRKDTLFNDYITRSYLVKPLDSLNIKNVDFIKIDVEGHELDVIWGGLNTISRHKPIMVIETSIENLSHLLNILQPFGYQVKQLNDIIGKVGTKENYIFLPTY